MTQQELLWKEQRRQVRELCPHSIEHVESAAVQLQEINQKPVTAETVIERRTMMDYLELYTLHIIQILEYADGH